MTLEDTCTARVSQLEEEKLASFTPIRLSHWLLGIGDLSNEVPFIGQGKHLIEGGSTKLSNQFIEARASGSVTKSISYPRRPLT